MSRLQTLRRLGRSADGATIIEFAIVLPVLSMLLMGTFDLGYRSYVGSIVQGSLHEASRMATVGNVSTSTIETHVRNRLQEFSDDATISVTTRSYSDFNGVQVPETITTDVAPLGTYNAATDCFRDTNENGQFDLDRGKGGMGGSEDVVYFEVSMRYPRLFPVGSLLGWSDDVTITQNTLLRNQPFAGRNLSTGPVVCPT
jgi:Flp pilus assembly pilin Flp